MKHAQHTTHNPKFEKMGLWRNHLWWYLKALKDPPTWLKVTITFERPQPHPQEVMWNQWIWVSPSILITMCLIHIGGQPLKAWVVVLTNLIQSMSTEYPWSGKCVDIDYIISCYWVKMAAVHLTHWGWVTHICISDLIIIDSDNGLSPGQCQAIIWTNAGMLLIGSSGTNFSEIIVEIPAFSCKKMPFKMSYWKRWPSCLCLNVLKSLLLVYLIWLEEEIIILFAKMAHQIFKFHFIDLT